MKKISRKHFLQLLSTTAGTLFLSNFFKVKKSYSLEKAITSLYPKVALIKGSQATAMTKKALDSIGGMQSIINPKDKVFIKPNYITGGLMGHDPVSAGEVPHPEVVLTVIEECVKAGAKEVVVGEWVERPPTILFGGKEGKEGAQIAKYVTYLNKKYGNKVSTINLMYHTSYFSYHPSSSKLDNIAIPNIVSEANKVISIAVLKTHHRPSPVTFGMKNLMGIMPSTLYGEPRSKLHAAGVHQVIVDINKATQTNLVVISGIYGMEGEGVSKHLDGKTVDLCSRFGNGVVLASTDPVACDAIATKLLTKDWMKDHPELSKEIPFYVHHLRMAHEQGLGEIDPNYINVVGDKLSNLQMNWEMPKNVFPELPGNEWDTANDPYLKNRGKGKGLKI